MLFSQKMTFCDTTNVPYSVLQSDYCSRQNSFTVRTSFIVPTHDCSSGLQMAAWVYCENNQSVDPQILRPVL